MASTIEKVIWSRAIGFLLIATCILTIHRSSADQLTATTPPESSWTPLTDDLSRSALFNENVIPAKLEENQRLRSLDLAMERAIPKDWLFPDDAEVDKLARKPRTNEIFGIDISHYTGPSISFDNLKLQHVQFVYAKATQGIAYKDDMFKKYWSRLAALPSAQKVYRGAYHFLSSGSKGSDQAHRFVDYVVLQGGFKADDMPPCLDLEWDRTSANPDLWKGHNPDDILQQTLDWMSVVKNLTGRVPLLYTARSWWRDVGLPEQKFSAFNDYPIWIADYSTSHKAAETPSVPQNRKQALWQFASDAKLTTGYEGDLDANIFYGTEDQFEQMFGIKH